MNGRMKHPQPLGLSLSVVGWSVGWLGIWLRGAAVRPVNQPGSDAGCHRRKRWRRADDLGAPLTPCTRHTERSSAASRAAPWPAAWPVPSVGSSPSALAAPVRAPSWADGRTALNPATRGRHGAMPALQSYSEGGLGRACAALALAHRARAEDSTLPPLRRRLHSLPA
jgi:hypothetical protein